MSKQVWIEPWIDRMGLIVALSGDERFKAINRLKHDMRINLTKDEQEQLRCAFRARFAPSRGSDGCKTAMNSLDQVCGLRAS